MKEGNTALFIEGAGEEKRENAAEGERQSRRARLVGWLSGLFQKPVPPRGLEAVRESLHPLRDALLTHRVYASIRTVEDIRIFMEHHVFAVWDLMCLLKALQNQLTCVTVPWLPTEHRESRRLINNIVRREESDVMPDGTYASHFEMYHAAMQQCSADTSAIDRFILRLREGDSVEQVLADGDVPPAARDFVSITWDMVRSGSLHKIAGAYTLGRETVVPDMFRYLMGDIRFDLPEQLKLFVYYLDRHLGIEENGHPEMALRMLRYLCGDEESRWNEVEDSAAAALKARLALWDSVADHIARR